MEEPVQRKPARRRPFYRYRSLPVKVVLTLLICVLILLVPYFVVSADNKSHVIDLGYARYEGQALRGGITQTLGIRYAAPPVGNLRFAAPQDPETNRAVKNADKVMLSEPPS